MNNLGSTKPAQVYTAIITPFKTDGTLDFDGFEKLLALQIEAEVTGVVVSGTTGEAPTLTDQEKLDLIRSARRILPKHMHVMAGTGSNDTISNIRLSLEAREAGADSLLIVTPPYNKPSIQGLTKHFRAIAEATALPVCLYHVPGRTGQLLTAASIATLTQIPGMKWVKEASGDLGLFGRACLQSKAEFLSGDDFTYLPSLAIGGCGVISVVTNVFPKAFVQMGRLFLAGEIHKAKQIHQVLFDFVDRLFCESNPSPVKAALHAAGFCQNVLRSPLAEVTAENYRVIEKSYRDTCASLSKLSLLEKMH
jgi:4-hydroxy-tetrahydrodipicolinate synthase